MTASAASGAFSSSNPLPPSELACTLACAARITALEKALRDETRLNATILKERDLYGQRWRHWEVQYNAVIGDAERWREHVRPVVFEDAWAVMERQGYNYGADALEQVRFGWELHKSLA